MADIAKEASTRYEELEDNFGLSKNEYKALVQQFDDEFEKSRREMEPRFDVWARRYKLLTNQKKKDTDFSDPLVFQHFNTLQAALYKSRGMQSFMPRTQADLPTTENLNKLAEYDYSVMGMDIHNYNIIFNSLLTGRALVLMMEFDRKNMVPIPEVINPMVWHRDPMATSVNGDQKGNGAMRFGGRPILKTKQQRDKAGYKNQSSMAKIDVLSDRNLDNLYTKVKEAKGLGAENQDWTTNKQLLTYEWFTWWNGERYFIVMDGGKRVVLKMLKLEKEWEGWPIIDYALFPDSQSWDGVSALDLLEDKQRLRNALINQAAFIVKSNQYPMYVYNVNALTKKTDLNFGFNKHIPVDVPQTANPATAIQPVQRGQVTNDTQWLLDYTQNSAERATGASAIEQGAMAGVRRTATEIANMAEGADSRFELMSKTLGWGEKRFWQMYYMLLKKHFKSGIDKKIIRINGINAMSFPELTRENIISKVDPDVQVESKIVSEARRLRKLQNFNSMFNTIINDPNIDRDYLFREAAKLNGMTQMEMDAVFKPDAQSLLQRKENEKLEKGEKVAINANDDDMKHLFELDRLGDQNSEAVKDHRERHMKAYIAKNSNPRLKRETTELQQMMQPPQIEAPTELNTPNALDTA